MAKQALDLNPRPDVLLCAGNHNLWGAYQYIKSIGLAIPEDIALMTFDDYPFARHLSPGITVMNIDLYDLGVQAARALFYIIDNPGVHVQMNIPSSEIIPRKSTEKINK